MLESSHPAHVGERCIQEVNLQAKMVFMIGMYWCARSPETERIKMRGFKVAGVIELGSEGATSGSAPALEDVVVEKAIDCLLM